MAIGRRSAASDAEIVALVLAGERDEYAELVHRHQEALYRHALGMLGSPDAAADLTQETLIRAFTRLPSCNDPSRFGAWAFRILRNGCLDYLKNRRRGMVPLEEDFAIDSATDDPEISLERGELRDVVFRALDTLPEPLREAFLLKHVEDLPYEEMTDRLGASASALKMRVKRAREALQVLLAPQHRGEM